MPRTIRPLRRVGIGLATGAAALALLPGGQAVAAPDDAPGDAPRKAMSCTHVSTGYLCLEVSEANQQGTIKVTYQRAADQRSRPGSLLYQRTDAAGTGTTDAGATDAEATDAEQGGQASPAGQTEAGTPTVVASPDMGTLDAGQSHQFGTATLVKPGCYRAGVVEDGGEPEWGGRICV